jgi:hypothetical protein
LSPTPVVGDGVATAAEPPGHRPRGEEVAVHRENAGIVVRPRLRRAVLGETLADWLEAGAAGHRELTAGPAGAAAVALVPEYVRAGAQKVLADLAGTDWTGTVVAVVGYGGLTRGRFAVEDAKDVLDAAGARVLDTSLGLDAARIRAEGFARADVLLRDLLFDRLAEHRCASRS